MIDEKLEAPKDSPNSSPDMGIVKAWMRQAEPHVVVEQQRLIMECVLASLPPDIVNDEAAQANILGGLLDGRLQVWGITGQTASGKLAPLGVGTTEIVTDKWSGAKKLLIFSLFAPFDVIPPAEYKNLFDTLAVYAKAQGCAKIELFTRNDAILRRARSLNFDTENRYCSVEIS